MSVGQVEENTCAVHEKFEVVQGDMSLTYMSEMPCFSLGQK